MNTVNLNTTTAFMVENSKFFYGYSVILNGFFIIVILALKINSDSKSNCTSSGKIMIDLFFCNQF